MDFSSDPDWTGRTPEPEWRKGLRRICVLCALFNAGGAMLMLSEPMTAIAAACIAVAFVFISRVV